MSTVIGHGQFGFYAPFAEFYPSGAGAARGGERTTPFARSLLDTVRRLTGSVTLLPSAPIPAPMVKDDRGAAAAVVPVVVRAQEMADRLVNRLGLPITALSDILDLERKTIYDWLKGAEATPANAQRLRALLDALGTEADGSLRYYHRFWKRPLPDGSSLRDVLMAPDLDRARIRDAMGALRDAVHAAIASDRGRGPVDLPPPHPADLLSAYLEAGSS
ncbi:hypothetical protein HB662_10215 [Roseomonas frigidaquae]|uniref:HTH cro/C1-type domain-containing protein n=1 Tax=Falsiroseomonas frigidaquae TaxID=487318 RepID=A0ABX1EYN7_9PROT|nr:hypothetical protein [Falsiroseomonas frigidaquae]NKE45154.1 hypothetical protein [Falsiroseomonas frigidaquae]